MSNKTYRRNHRRAWDYFVSIGKIPMFAKKNEWCLHHKDTNLRVTDPERYNEWRVEDLVPMLKADHSRLHQTGNRNRLGKPSSKETCAKISKALSGNIPWNKGQKLKPLTQETKMKMSLAHKGRSWYNDGERSFILNPDDPRTLTMSRGRIK